MAQNVIVILDTLDTIARNVSLGFMCASQSESLQASAQIMFWAWKMH